MAVKTYVEVRARKRVPTHALVTVLFDATIVDQAKLIEATRLVLTARGVDPGDITDRITGSDNEVDIEKCLIALMEESVTALGTATGAVIGDISCYRD